MIEQVSSGQSPVTASIEEVPLDHSADPCQSDLDQTNGLESTVDLLKDLEDEGLIDLLSASFRPVLPDRPDQHIL
jgi:hypothetical protein